MTGANTHISPCVCRTEQLYQKVMSLWHQLHVNMKSVVSWHYLLKDIRTVSEWTLDTVRLQQRLSVLLCSVPVCPVLIFVLCVSRFAVSLRQSASRSWTTWSLSWPTSCPTAERALCSRRVKDGSWSLRSSRPSSSAGTCWSTWRPVRLQQPCGNTDHLMLMRCQLVFTSLSLSPVEKDESVSRLYLTELHNITLRLKDTEQRLLSGIQTPAPSRRSADGAGSNSVQIAEQEVSLGPPAGCRQ